MTRMRSAALLLAASPLALANAAKADEASQLKAIEQQIQALQSQLHHMQHELATARAERAQAIEARTVAQTPPAAPTAPLVPQGYALVATTAATPPALVKVEPATPALPPGSFKLRGVTVTIGGFLEAAGYYRSRNEVADIGSNFNTGIPLPNSPLYHEGQLGFSARQSRISLDAKADPDSVTHIDGYGEIDFQAAAPTANSVESNSYNPRIRALFATYERSDLGLHVLAGQDWSLLTMGKSGISGNTGDVNAPLTIDPQYVVGFNWTRQPQVRITQELNKQLWLALSVENPQQSYYTGPNGLAPSAAGTINITNPGGSTFASTTNYSDEVAPDIIAKIAYDMPLAHLEAYGLARFLHDRVSHTGSGSENTVLAGGGGGAALIHIVPKMLDIQASALAGEGIGRYGTSQLPDAVVGPDGAPKPIKEIQALVGIVAHPQPAIDLYGYGGIERADRNDFTEGGKGYGYGSPLYTNTGCETELASASTCVANTSSIAQGTVGGWWKFLHSKDFGTLQLGLQYSYTHRSIFDGVGPTPKTDVNAVFVSFRFYPFADNAPSAPPAY